MFVQDAAQASADRALRSHWNGEYPVDPVGIASKLGIEVKAAEFRDPDTSGAIIATDPEDVTIYFAKSDPYPRQKFTVAHELGHFYDRLEANDTDYSFVETRHPASYDLHEFYADEFAGNLLMPSSAIVSMWASGAPVQEIANYFAVSTPAVRKRLERLRKYGEIQ